MGARGFSEASVANLWQACGPKMSTAFGREHDCGRLRDPVRAGIISRHPEILSSGFDEYFCTYPYLCIEDASDRFLKGPDLGGPAALASEAHKENLAVLGAKPPGARSVAF